MDQGTVRSPQSDVAGQVNSRAGASRVRQEQAVSSFRIAPVAGRDIPALDRKLANFADAEFSKILVEHEHFFIFKSIAYR